MEAQLVTERKILERAPIDEPLLTRALRRTAELTIAAVLLLISAPFLVALALAIRLDSPGPVLFRQRRVGYRMRPFTVFKFRTMRDGADERLHRDYVHALIAGDPINATRAAGEPLYKLDSDVRVTRIGRTMRRFSLDELPQLWNVLRGDMSLVGPRPVIPYEVEDYPVWYYERFAVKPGLTGLWQVSGRNTKTYEEMVGLDIEYVRSRRVALDLRILLKTIRVVLRSEGAA